MSAPLPLPRPAKLGDLHQGHYVEITTLRGPEFFMITDHLPHTIHGNIVELQSMEGTRHCFRAVVECVTFGTED